MSLLNLEIPVGAWSAFAPPTTEERTIFDQAFQGDLCGIYEPYEVSHQVVNGVNYRFKCHVFQPNRKWKTTVDIFLPVRGTPDVVTYEGVIELLDKQLEVDGTFAKALCDSLEKARASAVCPVRGKALDKALFEAINETFDGYGWPVFGEDYLIYLTMFSKLVPNEISSKAYPNGWKSTATKNGHNQKIYDLLCHFYWLINQPIQVNGEPITLQAYAKDGFLFADWIVLFNRYWGTFLNTPQSLTPATLDSFQKDPPYHLADSSDYIGSWNCFNDFFYRQLNGADPKSGISPLRPIVSPEDNRVVVSPADCTFHQAYSIDESGNIPAIRLKYTHQVETVQELLDGSRYAKAFSNGTFVHYFLSPFDYHRFHLPVSGRVLECRAVTGVDYLNVALSNGQFDAPDGSEGGYEFTQARGVVVIDTAESPCGDIGKVAIIPVGMAQVSSVHMYTELAHQVLEKGYEFGKFAFGGSDIIMLFEKDPALYLNEYLDNKSKTPIHFKYGEAAALWDGLYDFEQAKLEPLATEMVPPRYQLTVSGTATSLNPEVVLVNTQIVDEANDLLIQVSGHGGDAIGRTSYSQTTDLSIAEGVQGVKVIGGNTTVRLALH